MTRGTQIASVEHYRINDHDAGETYQATVLHLVDGTVVGYRQDEDDNGHLDLTPLSDALRDVLMSPR